MVVKSNYFTTFNSLNPKIMKLFIQLVLVLTLFLTSTSNSLAQQEINGSLDLNAKFGGEPTSGCIQTGNNPYLNIFLNLSFVPGVSHISKGYVNYFLILKHFDFWGNLIKIKNPGSLGSFGDSLMQILTWDPSYNSYFCYGGYSFIDTNVNCKYFIEADLYGVTPSGNADLLIENLRKLVGYCEPTEDCTGLASSGYSGSGIRLQNSENTRIRIMPNPISSKVYFEFQRPPKIVKLRDLKGRLLFLHKEDEPFNNLENYIINLNPGCYLFEAEYPQHVIVKKIIKI